MSGSVSGVNVTELKLKNVYDKGVPLRLSKLVEKAHLELEMGPSVQLSGTVFDVQILYLIRGTVGIVKEVDLHYIFTMTVKVNVSESKGESDCVMVKRRLFGPPKETSEVETLREASYDISYTLREPAINDIQGGVNVNNAVGNIVESALVKVVLYWQFPFERPEKV